jgi:hypothetical protein
LRFRAGFTDVVKLSFARIDGIIGDNLPMEAYKSERWWDNSPNVHSKAWLDAGFEAQEVNLKQGYVVFKKSKNAPVLIKRRKTRESQVKKPFTPVPVRISKPKVPSKTKLSKLYARIKNLEKQRKAVPQYHGSFKPKPKHEKTLFKMDEKPK